LLEHLQDFNIGGNQLLRQAIHADAFARHLLHLQLAIVSHQEVTDLITVNLHEVALNSKLTAEARATADALKYLPRCPGHYALHLCCLGHLRTEHTMGLPSACWTICQDGTMVAHHDVIDKWQGNIVIHYLLRCALGEDLVKVKSVLEVVRLNNVLMCIDDESRTIGLWVILGLHGWPETHCNTHCS
jgi:hypothetical protein